MAIRALVLGLALFLFPFAAHAQSGDEPAPSGASVEQQNFLYFLFGGGGMLGVACTVPILLMSMAALAMFIEHLLTIRRSVIIPAGLAEEAHGLIANRSFVPAEQQCRLRPSFLSYVILAGLQEVAQGYGAVDKAMEDASHAQAARIFRKIEFLSVIANISTMLGLFGTVVGLVVAFKRVADTQGIARAADLAGGIYLALMTTIEGLTVAIPCVAAYAIFKHRADQLVAEASLMAEYAFSGYKRERQIRRAPEGSKAVRGGNGG
jgi:biopolymer transport protein ExbB